MLIKALTDVTTEKEKVTITDVRWGRVDQKGEPRLAQKATITGVWKRGCSLVTRHSLLVGETIWLKARDELGRPILSLIGTVTWNENCFRLDGYRCEVRFR